MKRAKHRCGSLTSALLALTACVDVSPVRYEGGAAPATIGPDAGGDGAMVGRCEECLATHEECAEDYDRCAEFPRCIGLIRCALELGCLTTSELAERLDCASPCLEELEMYSHEDEDMVTSLPVNFCSLGPCLEACTE